MKDISGTESRTAEKSGIDTIRKKAYQHPVLRLYGAIHMLTRGPSSTSNLDGSSGMTPMPSDRRVKENVILVGKHPLGIGLYLFDYRPEYRERCGHGRQFGVMADEVETIMPEAVSMHPDGYKMVDYALLGVRPST